MGLPKRASACIHTFQTPDYIQSLELINSDLIASANYDNTISFYNLKKFECVQTIQAHGNAVECIKLINPNLLASGSRDDTIKFWNLNDFS